MLIAVHSQTGGVGKTVAAGGLAAALASELAQGGDQRAVVLAEANAVRSTLRWAMAGACPLDWCEALRAERPVEEAMVPLEPLELGVQLLAGPESPEQWGALTLDRLIAGMEAIRERGVTVVDTGQHLLTPVHTAAVSRADIVVVVTSLFGPRVQALADWWIALELFASQQRRAPLVAVVLGLERTWDGRSARRQLRGAVPDQVPIFSMAPAQWQDPYSRSRLPELEGQFGSDMVTLARHLLTGPETAHDKER